MRLKYLYVGIVVVLSLYVWSCKNPNDPAPPDIPLPSSPIATLPKTVYTIGEPISISLSYPLRNITLTWDKSPSTAISATNNRLTVSSADKKVGHHQLIVNGTATNKQQTSDTLYVELLSDIQPKKYTYSVIKTYPHSTNSFTQGLLFYKNNLYESTGLNGLSRLMKMDIETGKILQSVLLSPTYFGEGIAVVKDHFYQLTWTSKKCFQYTPDFKATNTYSYPSEGWGLTNQDTTLIMSDGTQTLRFYSPAFALQGELEVYDNKGPILNLNELEYVQGYVWANSWKSNRMVQIDLKTGKVVGELTIDPALPNGVDTQKDVLNGIAFQPNEPFLYITGKNWPSLFKIQVDGLF